VDPVGNEVMAPLDADEPGPRRPDPFPLRWWMPPALILPALFFRALNISVTRNAIDDSSVHVLTALSYARTGLLGPDAWWSPPLKHLVNAVGILLLGNDIIAWRFKGALFGAVSVYLVFLVARRAFRHELPAFAAAVLLMLDPFSIAMAHTTQEDLPAVCFTLLGVIFFLRWVDDGNGWGCFAAGAFLGAAVGLRWYAAPVAIALALCALWIQRKRIAEASLTLVTFFSSLFAVYLAAYLPWIARGYSLPDWLALQYDALMIQGPRYSLAQGMVKFAGAEKWFVTWIGGRAPTGQAAETLTNLVNDPVIWVLFVPSALLLCYAAFKQGRAEWAALGGALVATYAYFLVSPRPIVLYSAMAIVPLGCVCLGFAMAYLLKSRGWVALGAAALWSLLLFPGVGGVWAPELLLAMLRGTVQR
jgi:4-amino-4-deoxy-L-arabinose transferase-like glycosyltransferase